MNVLLSEDLSTFQKIAVKLGILVFVTVIFLGDNVYFSGQNSASKASANAVSDLQISNPDSYKASVKEVREKLWKLSLQRRYGDVIFNKIQDGAVHIRLKRYLNGKPLTINVIEVNSSVNSNIKVIPAMAGSQLAKKSSVVDIAKKYNSFAAINGSYFKPQTGIPLGILMVDKKLLTGPIFDRVALGITDSGFKMDRVSLNANLNYGDKQLKVDNINQPRTICTDILVYTTEWGKISPPTPKYGIQALISEGKLVKKSFNSLEIPENGFVVSGPQNKIEEILVENIQERKIFRNKKESVITLDIKTNPNWEDVNHIISGGPFLVKSGNIYVDYVEEKFKPITGRNPRTAIGYTKEGNLIMATIDGREETSVGAGLFELAKIMKSFECEYAMNLDGGGSSTMQINGRIVNNPSVKGGIAVSNAVALVNDTGNTEKITFAEQE